MGGELGGRAFKGVVRVMSPANERGCIVTNDDESVRKPDRVVGCDGSFLICHSELDDPIFSLFSKEGLTGRGDEKEGRTVEEAKFRFASCVRFSRFDRDTATEVSSLSRSETKHGVARLLRSHLSVPNIFFVRSSGPGAMCVCTRD